MRVVYFVPSYILFINLFFINDHFEIRYNTEPKITQRYDTIKNLMRKILDLQA